MNTNYFIREPLRVVIYDPVKNLNRRIFVFLGDVAKNIWNACNYYHTVTAAQRASYDKLLKEHYGSDYKSKLGLDIKDYQHAWISTIEKEPEDADVHGGAPEHPFAFGSNYDIECVRARVHDRPVEHVRVSELSWILSGAPRGYFDDPHERSRVQSADLNIPLLLTRDDRLGIVTLDNIHKLQRAVETGACIIPAKFIPTVELNQCRVDVYAHTNARKYTGGAIDDIDDSDIEALLNEPTLADTTPARAAKSITSSVSAEELRAEFEPGIEYITDIHVYPEDKFNELKDKVYLATNIPAYRQHMFYLDRNRLHTSYKVYAEGIYNIDIRKIMQFRDTVHGIPIDKFLYDIRSSIRVEALDTFKVLEDTVGNNVVYVVDLAQFTSRSHSQLMDVVNDTYQFELFYYGFVIKYWPQLTQECFYDYMVSEPELQHKYPELAKNKINLASVYKTEREIIDFNYKNITKALSYADSSVTIAITQMIATVSGSRVMLNIRNLFDKLRVTRIIPEIHAYVEHNNKRYLLRKRHIRNGSDIQFPSGSLMKNGITIAISLKKSDQESFHAKSTISTMENEQSRYLFLNIWPNGKYFVKTVWNEEDELGFDDIIKIMKKFTDPIIHGINNLGRYAFISGSELPLMTKQNVNYQGLNICVFWKKVMLESTFKVVRGLWEPYMRARITGQRNVQQFDKYEFLFRKGMYQFDSTAIERIVTASNNIVLNNHYAYLSNNTIKQKWDQNYDGRIVRMSHRTTDVRFEVSDIREQEFQTFYTYIVIFVYRALLDEKVKTALITSRSYKDVKKLRKLREQDPELYNLKKYGSKKVYSIICQNQRQPLIYTPDELKNMPAAEVKKLTQYWNFTLNKPAYYGCPNKKYPHLSFMVNAHPRHYCLPCCNKKSQSSEESKKTRINSVCLQKHKYLNADTSEGNISRHVMNYGKDIDIGRLSKLPQTSIKNLLFGTLQDTKLNYYLYGVAQHVPGVENIGLLYAAAESLGVPMEELVKKIIHELKGPNAGPLFNTLLNGTLLEYFRSMDDLVLTIKDMFLDMKMFSKELQKFKQWPELFMEILHILFKVSIFTFIDDDGSGNAIELFVPDILKNEVLYVSKLAAGESDPAGDGEREHGLVASLMAEQIYMLMIKKQNRYYPIFIIDAERYFKTFEIESRKYIYADRVIKLIYNMIKYEARGEDLSVEKMIDLSLIKAFTMKHNARMVTKFVNRQNLCYAVILETAEGLVYVPVDYSVYVSDNIPITFEAFNRAKYDLSYSVLKSFLDKFNNFIQENYRIGSGSLYSYKLMIIKNYIGIAAEDATTHGLIGLTADTEMIFYFNKYHNSELEPDVPVKVIKYDYNDVNALIISRAPPVEDNRTKLIGESLYNNYLYQLFVVEFINYLERERNNIIRAKLKAIITETNFKKDVSVFRKELKTLLEDYPADYVIMQNQLIAFYYTYFNKSLLLEQIDLTIYDFDRVTMNRLKKLSREDLKVELRKIAESFSIQKDFDSTAVNFPNIYMPCDELIEETGYCERGKLIINQPMDTLIDILATDIMDDLKSKYLLNNLWQDVTQDFLTFTRWVSEVISIFRLNE